jgi:ATP-dependent helicase Lhr and Lhr-like helicase
VQTEPSRIVGPRARNVPGRERTEPPIERREAYVEPSDGEGRSRWEGSTLSLHFRLCRAMRRVLAEGNVPVRLTKRATARLEEACDDLAWVNEEGTALVRQGNDLLWWTFAGRKANQALAQALGGLAESPARATNLYVRLNPSTEAKALQEALARLREDTVRVAPLVVDEAITGLKFSTCLPEADARRIVGRTVDDPEAVRACLEDPLRVVTVAED